MIHKYFIKNINKRGDKCNEAEPEHAVESRSSVAQLTALVEHVFTYGEAPWNKISEWRSLLDSTLNKTFYKNALLLMAFSFHFGNTISLYYEECNFKIIWIYLISINTFEILLNFPYNNKTFDYHKKCESFIMRAKYSFSMDVCTSCLLFARMHSAYLVGKLPCNFGILLACFYCTPCITLFTINLQNTFRMETDLYRINKKSLSLVDQIPSVLFINRYVQFCPITFFFIYLRY